MKQVGVVRHIFYHGTKNLKQHILSWNQEPKETRKQITHCTRRPHLHTYRASKCVTCWVPKMFLCTSSQWRTPPGKTQVVPNGENLQCGALAVLPLGRLIFMTDALERAASKATMHQGSIQIQRLATRKRGLQNTRSVEMGGT